MLSNYAKNAIINGSDGRVGSITLAGTAYLALSSTEPHADGTNVTEPTGNGYKRALMGDCSQSLTQKMGAASNGAASNTSDIHFDEATGAWPTQNYGCIFDAVSGGHLIAWAALTSPITPGANTVPLVKAGNLTITIS